MSRFIESSKTKPCVIYSFGVRDESSFENEMLTRTNCEVWAYDFSVVDFGVQLEPANRARAHFLQAGIAGTTDKTKDPPFYSISDLMKMNGHEYMSVPPPRSYLLLLALLRDLLPSTLTPTACSDILKMDIEAAEFDAMDGLSRDFPASAGKEFPVGQYMVEIHFFPGDKNAGSFLKW